MSIETFIIAAARCVDGVGNLDATKTEWQKLRAQGARLAELVIDPLAAGWSTPIAPNHFRSGCAPIEALARADEMIRANQFDAVMIRGEDNLRSRFAENKSATQKQMAIYGDECSIPQAYTELARVFMDNHRLSKTQFKDLAAALFENYTRTARRFENYAPPRESAFAMVTDLFRLVDCANPVVDFSGAIIVASNQFAPERAVKILAVRCAQTAGDGPEFIEEIARYDHLRQAFKRAQERAGIDFADQFRKDRALLETYTCFPVAPLGFIFASGIVESFAEAKTLLAEREITVTGGMNLARAPWNNPALNALIVMFGRLTENEGTTLGAVHGNGGLGYRQGVAILQRV